MRMAQVPYQRRHAGLRFISVALGPLRPRTAMSLLCYAIVPVPPFGTWVQSGNAREPQGLQWLVGVETVFARNRMMPI
jgi:hypothetical protein